MKVKTILVSQPEPKVDNSPYFELQQKHKVKIDFRPFIHVEGVNAKEIRLQKIDLNNPYLNNNIDANRVVYWLGNNRGYYWVDWYWWRHIAIAFISLL